MLMDVKKCARCGGIFHVSKFNKNSSMPDGLQIHCKKCERIAKAAYRKKIGGRAKLKKTAKDVVDGVSNVSCVELAKMIIDVY